MIGLALLALASLVTSQMRVERAIRRVVGVSASRLDEIGYRLQRAEAARHELETQLAALREEVADLEHVAARGRRDQQVLVADLDRLKVLAAFRPVTGPGVLVVLEDSPRRLDIAQNPNDLLVHYTDLQAVVNDLFSGGADAVAVNRERISVTSTIQCVGATVLVNARRLAAPFRVEAIGDPGAPVDFLRRQGGPLETLQASGLPVRILRRSSVTLPAFRGTLRAPGGQH